ncbi:hypothetical protein SPRG_18830 [Saprolegnia parasitica CBS 223.65]|uniref:WRKY19-like zinc finger domain-containing protein n=1 Tax=Saprolegnia parasitica (strain CBS 223.65) TaxID=695850 RepID=A0A067D2I0_SAPPC|nr:hypothetical protein SPRG_18830 [Saprolegnia parasitica CBS 223.65]KDO35670.1 hypothetical protein SPRG_18830 [Saprolegnia parasitica CBS 223.65]|eukprot:XP_012194046.1 hypothetical protein SPRG_18830 [Saprolegnia parasitica CBS 223.65]
MSSDLSFKDKVSKSLSFLSVLGKKKQPEPPPSRNAYPPPPSSYYGYDARTATYDQRAYEQQQQQQPRYYDGAPPPLLPPMHPYVVSAPDRVDELLCTPTPEARFPTPTPDIKYPSPYDFAKDRPTPVEKMEDLQQLQEALLPSPFDYLRKASGGINYQQPQPQSQPMSGNDYRVADEINTLCRDLVSHGMRTKESARKYSTASSVSSMSSVSSSSLPRANSRHDVFIKSEPTTNHAYGDFIELATANGGYSSGGGKSYDSDSSSGGAVKHEHGSGAKQYRRKNCSVEGCSNLSRSKGLCKAHGGGRRCSVEGCTRASQSSSLCIAHGGGKRCTVEGCTKAAQSRGMCKAHGGGVRCRIEGCTKSSQGDGYCRSHGGGRRCGHPSGCLKWAQRNGMCMTHSEGKYGNSYRGRLARQSTDDEMDDTDMT